MAAVSEEAIFWLIPPSLIAAFAARLFRHIDRAPDRNLAWVANG